MRRVIKLFNGVDLERLFLLPLFFVLLLASVVAFPWTDRSSDLWQLHLLHRVLSVSFYVMLVALLVFRARPSQSRTSWRAGTAAYAGTFAPFLLVLDGASPPDSQTLTILSILLMIAGLAYTVLSLAWLGRSFGVVPKARVLVSSGPYRHIRHPLYVGEFVSFLGVILGAITPFSAAVYISWVIIQRYRALQEETVLLDAFPTYESYMAQTGRFFPRLREAAVATSR